MAARVATLGTVTASHKILACKHLQARLMPALQREAAWAEERLWDDLRQSDPQNRRAQLLGLKLSSCQWTRRVAKTSLTQPGFWEHFEVFFWGEKKQQNAEFAITV